MVQCCEAARLPMRQALHMYCFAGGNAHYILLYAPTRPAASYSCAGMSLQQQRPPSLLLWRAVTLLLFAAAAASAAQPAFECVQAADPSHFPGASQTWCQSEPAAELLAASLTGASVFSRFINDCFSCAATSSAYSNTCNLTHRTHECNVGE
jgi:hypothetical protein